MSMRMVRREGKGGQAACISRDSMAPNAQVVKRRGESMAAAAKLGKPHGMLSIIGLSDAVLEEVCQKARVKIGGDTVCRIANYLFPTGRVASGHKDALAEVPCPTLLLQLIFFAQPSTSTFAGLVPWALHGPCIGIRIRYMATSDRLAFSSLACTHKSQHTVH